VVLGCVGLVVGSWVVGCGVGSGGSSMIVVRGVLRAGFFGAVGCWVVVVRRWGSVEWRG
jgi:hypothetical protein